MAGLPHLGEAEQLAPRRLAAIAFLDVVGYSRLMGADEDGTLRRWSVLRRETIEPRVGAWRGRVVDRAGDGIFVEFRAALDAFRWAVDVQDAAAPAAREEPPMQVRVALHLGDVRDGPDGEVQGDGVNTAARLQLYAEPGGVVLSKAIADEVAGKTGAHFLDLGELRLRNIARPIHAYSLRPTEGAPRPRGASGPRADPRPSIAVLPFRRDRDDPREDSLADGILEGIVHVLSGLADLFVIARGSTLGYDGEGVDPRGAGRELGVRYVLHGSVRRSGDRVRITTELSDAENGAVLRSDRHDGVTADVFDLQDRISAQVATTIAPRVRERELARAGRKQPGSLNAYDLVLQAMDHLHPLDRASFSRARTLLRRAMSEDSGYALAHSYAAWWHVLHIAQGWSADVEADAAEAARLAAAAIERDRNDALALAIYGYVTAYATKDFATATQLLDRALAAGPNCPLAWTLSGIVRAFLGDGPNAVERIERGLRLSPFDPFAFLHEHFLSQAYYTCGDHEAAVVWARRAAAQNPRHAPTLRTLVASLVAAERYDEVCASAQRLLAVEPSFRVTAFAARTPLRGTVREAFVRHLREAGLPD